MIEQTVQNALISNNVITSKLSIYNDAPAIFSNSAPEDVEEPYLIYDIIISNTDQIVSNIRLSIDYYSHESSLLNMRECMNEVINLFDYKYFDSDRYDTVRLFFSSGTNINDNVDSKLVHYNVSFDGRAGRKSWCQQI